MLTRIEGEPCFKPKRVIMHITPKQFTVKEFIFKFLMKRIATYRVCPSTKVKCSKRKLALGTIQKYFLSQNFISPRL